MSDPFGCVALRAMRTLARHVLEDGDTPAVMEHAVRAVAGTLGVDRVQVFEQIGRASCRERV